MANTYEYKIEDINLVIITDQRDTYTTTYKRKINEDKTPTNLFIETYSAENDTSEEGIIGVICPYCGDWNYYTETVYNTSKRNLVCESCDNKTEVIIEEDDLIDQIMNHMQEDKFLNFAIFINGNLIH